MTAPPDRTMPPLPPNPAEIDRDGYAIVAGVIDDRAADALLEALGAPAPAAPAAAVRERRGATFGVRDLLAAVPAVRELADSPAVRRLIEPALGPGAFAVRGLLFDKTPSANWKVPWHQDLTIAVRERRDAPGFGPWSLKAGIPHVQPPPAVLGRMLTLRLHLDDCDEANGPLKVLPGSHAHGVLSAEQIARWRDRVPPVACTVPRGGAVLMRPMILHASSPAESPRHRRVVHLEFAADPLPCGLQWYE